MAAPEDLGRVLVTCILVESRDCYGYRSLQMSNGTKVAKNKKNPNGDSESSHDGHKKPVIGVSELEGQVIVFGTSGKYKRFQKTLNAIANNMIQDYFQPRSARLLVSSGQNCGIRVGLLLEQTYSMVSFVLTVVSY